MMNILNITALLPVSATLHYYPRAASPTVIVIHHSATGPDVTAKAIAEYHVYGNGWPGIGYHFLVYANGKINQVNDVMTMSYHAGDGSDSPLNTNRMGIGVCLVGDFTHTPPPAAQLAAARELIAHLGLPFIPHREAYNTVTTCPGDTWDSWKDSLKEGGKMLNNIGLHIIGTTSLPLANDSSRPSIVKLVDPSVAYVRAVRAQVGPDCLIVIRWYQVNQPMDNPKQNAADWFNIHLAFINAVKGANIIFVGYCEIADSNAANYASHELERGRLLHGTGANCGYFEFSVGVPDIPVWATYQPVLNDMHPGDYVCLHEYAIDNADIDNRWHCGRWTKVPQLAGKPIAVTEFNRDVVEGRGQPGWQKTTDASGFKADLRKYSALLTQYPNVKGATVFQDGSSDPQWSPFGVASIWRDVVAEYTISAPVAPPAPPPHEGLPMDETATDAKTLVQKSTWWLEEMQRQFEADKLDYANRIRLSLIQLMYRAENSL